MPISLHLDENVHLAIADALRRRGIDVTTAADAHLIGASDDQHLDFARAQQRIVFTHDVDFLRLHAKGTNHAGIAFCHTRKYNLRALILVLSRFSIGRTPEFMGNRIEYL